MLFLLDETNFGRPSAKVYPIVLPQYYDQILLLFHPNHVHIIVILSFVDSDSTPVLT